MFNLYANTVGGQLARKLSILKQIQLCTQRANPGFATFQQRMASSPANQHLFKSTNISFKSPGHRLYVYALSPTCDFISTHQYQVGASNAIALTFYPDSSEAENSYEQRKSCHMNCKEVLELLKIKPRSGGSLLQTNEIEIQGKVYTKTMSVSDLVDKKAIQIRAGQTVKNNQIEENMWEIDFSMEYPDFRVFQQHLKDNLGYISGAQLMLELDKENQLHLVDSIPFKRKEK